MDEKIYVLLDALYELSFEEKKDFETEISAMDNPSKEAFALALYKRYESYNSNLGELDRGLQFISNDIVSFKEQEEAENIEFNY